MLTHTAGCISASAVVLLLLVVCRPCKTLQRGGQTTHAVQCKELITCEYWTCVFTDINDRRAKNMSLLLMCPECCLLNQALGLAYAEELWHFSMFPLGHASSQLIFSGLTSSPPREIDASL